MHWIEEKREVGCCCCTGINHRRLDRHGQVRHEAASIMVAIEWPSAPLLPASLCFSVLPCSAFRASGFCLPCVCAGHHQHQKQHQKQHVAIAATAVDRDLIGFLIDFELTFCLCVCLDWTCRLVDATELALPPPSPPSSHHHQVGCCCCSSARECDFSYHASLVH